MNRNYTIKDFDFLVILEIFEAISKNHSNNSKGNGDGYRVSYCTPELASFMNLWTKRFSLILQIVRK